MLRKLLKRMWNRHVEHVLFHDYDTDTVLVSWEKDHNTYFGIYDNGIPTIWDNDDRIIKVFFSIVEEKYVRKSYINGRIAILSLIDF